MLDKIKNLKNKNTATFLLTAIAVILAYKIIMNIEGVAKGIANGFDAVADLLMPFIIGGVIAYLLNPLVKYFNNRLFGKIKKIGKFSNILSLITVYIIVAASLVLILNMLIPLLVKSIADIAAQIPDYFKKLMEFRNGEWNHSVIGRIIFNTIASVEDELANFASSYKLTSLNPAITGIVGSVASLTGSIIDYVFGIIISIYFILEQKQLLIGTKRIMRAVFKTERAEKIGGYALEAHGIFSSYIIGKIIDSLIIGVIAFIAFLIMRVDNSALYSVIIGVTNMIPYFGPFIGGIPVVLLVLFTSPLQALWVGIFIFALQQADGMIIGPKIIGNSIDLSPFWIIFATIVGGGLFGVIGMFLGAPTIAIIILAVNRLLDKKLSQEESIDGI